MHCRLAQPHKWPICYFCSFQFWCPIKFGCSQNTWVPPVGFGEISCIFKYLASVSENWEPETLEHTLLNQKKWTPVRLLQWRDCVEIIPESCESRHFTCANVGLSAESNCQHFRAISNLKCNKHWLILTWMPMKSLSSIIVCLMEWYFIYSKDSKVSYMLSVALAGCSRCWPIFMLLTISWFVFPLNGSSPSVYISHRSTPKEYLKIDKRNQNALHVICWYALKQWPHFVKREIERKRWGKKEREERLRKQETERKERN